MDAKRAVREILDRLPDGCSIEDVLHQLYAVHEIEMGRADVTAGRTFPHDQVARDLRRKWLDGAET